MNSGRHQQNPSSFVPGLKGSRRYRQLHAGWAVKQDCLITTSRCRDPPGSHTPWLCGRWGIRDVEFLRLLAPPAQVSPPEGPYYLGKLQIRGVASPMTTQGQGTASNETGSSNIYSELFISITDELHYSSCFIATVALSSYEGCNYIGDGCKV